VTLRDGRRLVERVLANRGGPERPLSRAELLTKFRANAGRVLDPDAVDRLADAILSFETRPVADTLALARASLLAPS
jgi:2-methylcitrate dehydratase PrpD